MAVARNRRSDLLLLLKITYYVNIIIVAFTTVELHCILSFPC